MMGISRKKIIVLFLVIAVIACGVYAVEIGLIGDRKVDNYNPAGRSPGEVANDRPVAGGVSELKDPAVSSMGSNAEKAKISGSDEKLSGFGGTVYQGTDGDSSLPSLKEKAIRTATLEIGVGKDKFNAVYDRAVETAGDAGGYVSRSNSTTRSDGKIAGGELIIRVPAENFDSVLKSLKKFGEIKSLAISSEEVTSEYVDLQSRLRSWRAQEAVMLDLMKRAETISESISIQNNLQRIQMEIEQISGRLKYLDDKVSYSEIRLYINEPSVVPFEEEQGIRAAFDKALDASLKMLSSIIIMLGYLVPLAIIGVLLLLVYALIKRFVIAKSA